VWFGFSFILVLLALVGVFIPIPFVSDWAFWFVIAAYIILANARARAAGFD
jgi:hypothetical protein